MRLNYKQEPYELGVNSIDWTGPSQGWMLLSNICPIQLLKRLFIVTGMLFPGRLVLKTESTAFPKYGVINLGQ